MKAPIIITLSAILLLSCSRVQDERNFLPNASFDTEAKQIYAEEGGFEIDILLSERQKTPCEIGIGFTGEAVEGVHFSVESHSITIEAGQQSATYKVAILNDNIWKEELSLIMILAPGEKYTIDPAGKCQSRITVRKQIILPFIGIRVAPEDTLTNPYLAETIHFTLFSSLPLREDTAIEISAGDDFMIGQDFLINQGESPIITFPSNSTEVPFEMQILKKDISGYDHLISVSPVHDIHKFIPDSDSSIAKIHLSDPIVDFSNLWRTYAQNNGTGYQQRQSIRGTNGEWIGNKVADMYVSQEGSNYLRSYRNMYSSQWNCMANTAGGNVLSLTNFVPSLDYPGDSLLADYGAASNNRFFSPCDSLFRFVLDEESTTEGMMTIDSPRTFTAFVSLRSIWDGGTSPDKIWQIDSRKTGGDIMKSTSPDIIDRIDVRLVKLVGRFNIADYTKPLIFTAWFESDSPLFMKEVDFSQYDITKEDDGTWRVDYLIYPR